MSRDARGKTMRLLLDTNIVIAHEDDDATDPHINTETASAVIRAARDLGFELLVSSGTRSDILRAPPDIQARRRRALDKYYTQLASVPESAEVRAQFPTDLTPNNQADLEVLSTYAAKVATVLVTEDVRMRARAHRAGLRNVFSLDEALEWLSALKQPTLDNATSAAMPEAYQVNSNAAIFETLRADYGPEDFTAWWDKVVDERRHVIILGQSENPTGIAVLKEESGEFDLGEKVLKVCTFKVDDGAGRSRRGELLLRAVVDYAVERDFPVAYMTVLPHHEKLLGWLRRFGFFVQSTMEDAQLVMAKRFVPPDGEPRLPPLEHQRRYGPRSMLVERPFIVPIRAPYHQRLFPDSEEQLTLLDNEDCGNAIRKAYLCRANIKQLNPGNTLLFLRTHGKGESRITAAGVVEETLRSGDPDEIAAFVAGRTVYTYAEICDMCDKREVLAILFRLDRRIDPPWYRLDLKRRDVMTSSPQSIAGVREAGVQWVKDQLNRR